MLLCSPNSLSLSVKICEDSLSNFLGGGGSKMAKFMKQKKKPKINSVGCRHMRVDNNKTNKTQAASTAPHGGGEIQFWWDTKSNKWLHEMRILRMTTVWFPQTYLRLEGHSPCVLQPGWTGLESFLPIEEATSLVNTLVLIRKLGVSHYINLHWTKKPTSRSLSSPSKSPPRAIPSECQSKATSSGEKIKVFPTISQSSFVLPQVSSQLSDIVPQEPHAGTKFVLSCWWGILDFVFEAC